MAVNPPTNPVPFRQCLDLLGRLLFVRNFRSRIRIHVGRPLWLLLFLASFLACWPPYFSPFLGSLSLRFCSEMVSAFFFGLEIRFVLGLLFCCWFSCKTGQNAVRFCFLFFAWVRSVLGLRPKKGTENRTERTLGCSGRNSAPYFLSWFFASPNGQFKNSEGSLLCYGWLLWVLFF